MPEQMQNRLLQQAEAKIETGLDRETAQNYEKIVVAGMSVVLEKGPDGILASLKNSRDPISEAAKGAVALVMILRKEAKGIMPEKALVPAAMTLLLKALDFADRAGIVKVRQPELVRATHVFTDAIFAAFQISRDGLQRAATKVHGFMQDPDAMRKINVKGGILPHPNAPPAPQPPGMINSGTATGEAR